MTFLEYILTQHIGEPIRVGSKRGESYWACPVCGSEKFHTMPDLPNYKHRTKCFRGSCNFRGDWKDMLEFFHPEDTQAELFARRDMLEQEWRSSGDTDKRPQFPGGRGVPDPRDVVQAQLFTALLRAMRFGLVEMHIELAPENFSGENDAAY